MTMIPEHLARIPEEEHQRLLRIERRYEYLKTAKTGTLHWQDRWLDVEDAHVWNTLIDEALDSD